MGSILGQLSCPEKRDSSKTLLSRWRLTEIDDATTIRAKVNKWSQAWEPPAKPERLGESIPLPEKDDKSKMLENLRMIQALRVTKQQVLIQKNRNDDYPDGEKKRRATEKQPEVLLEDPTTTRITTLQPVSSNVTKKDNDSDTCEWHGRQPLDIQRKDLNDLKDIKKKKESELNIENVGQKLMNVYKCIMRKFKIAYAKIKTKICSWFGGKKQEPPPESQTPAPAPSTTTRRHRTRTTTTEPSSSYSRQTTTSTTTRTTTLLTTTTTVSTTTTELSTSRSRRRKTTMK